MTTTPGRLAHGQATAAGQDFLMRLVAKHGLRGAARVLRALADEIEGLAVDVG